MSTVKQWIGELDRGLDEIAGGRERNQSAWRETLHEAGWKPVPSPKSSATPSVSGDTACPSWAPGLRWPYSGFFDWFDPYSPDGYLPPMLDAAVAPAGAGRGGLRNGTYYVNTSFLFVGLNPTRCVGAMHAVNPLDRNCGSFINFNLASELSLPPLSCWLSYCSWRGIGAFVKRQNPWSCTKAAGKAGRGTRGSSSAPCYAPFVGSYMVDVAPLVVAKDNKEARERLRQPTVAAACERMFQLELDTYAKLLQLRRPPTLVCLGGESYRRVVDFAGVHPGIWSGARICQVHHFAYGVGKLLVELCALSSGKATGVPSERWSW